ncbi:MAG: FAD-dependent oxidoreductase [Proteobacteria bacterium]|nr:FAD-dependent oxidoreductase [Pseudomonadota bacterium]
MISQGAQAQVEEVIDELSGKVCLPPCQIACPLGVDIQRTNTMIAHLPLDTQEASSLIIKIGDELYEKNPMFPICGYICGLCEKECNYKDQTGAVRRKLLVRFIADYYLPHLETRPRLAFPSKEKIAVIGGGPGGLMCAYMLGKNGHRVTIFERGFEMGGVLRLVPQYRLSKETIDTTLNTLVRIAHIEVKYGVKIGNGGKTLDDLKNEGYRAIFIATGTPFPRPLTFGRELVAGTKLEGVLFGLDILTDVNQGKVSPQLFQDKKVIVLGGGNVAFDVARTVRRLGGNVSVVCLECEDKSSKDGIPADVEEIEGGREEGISITYSRGVEEIIGEDSKFKKIKCPRCTSVFDENGIFNPRFDQSDSIYLEGDVLLVTIGQAQERSFFQQEDLLDEKGSLDIDQLTLMSNRKQGFFLGGDVRRVGFAAEAMRDGMIIAESIERYLKGEDLRVERKKEYEGAPILELRDYKPQTELSWKPVEERMDFSPFEKGFTLEEAVEEAKRCLCCGPCVSCKACIALELQPEIPEIEIKQDICIGCGLCESLCSYHAVRLKPYEEGGEKAANIVISCKGCGLCVASCPQRAITISHFSDDHLVGKIWTLAEEGLKEVS